MHGSLAPVADSSWLVRRAVPEDVAFIFAATVIFVFFFSIKTAPWIWDNLKIGVWAYFIVLPFLWLTVRRGTPSMTFAAPTGAAPA